MIEINLLPEELKIVKKEKKIPSLSQQQLMPLLLVLVGVLLLVHVVLGALQLAKTLQAASLQRQLKVLGVQKQELSASSDSISAVQLAQRVIPWSQKLHALSLSLPSGMWFNELNVSRGTLKIWGSVVSLKKEEMALITGFLETLKKNPSFVKNFSGLELGTLTRRTLGGFEIIDFVLTCKAK